MSVARERTGTPRWRRRSALLFGVGSSLLLLAVLFRTPVPIFLGVPLLVAPLAAAWTAPRALARVDLRWGTAGEGADLAVVGTLEGGGSAHADDLRLDVRLPSGLSPARPWAFVPEDNHVAFRGSWRAVQPLVATVPPPRLVWTDPLELTERTLDGERPELAVARYPSGFRGLGQVRLERTVLLPGEARSRRLGPSGEFFGLRDALPREPPNRINWKATARVGRRLANDYELERSGDLVIVLDRRPTSLGREDDQRLLGLGRAAVYGLVDSLLRSKVRVGFASFGEFVSILPLSTGRAHRLRILAAVRQTELSEVAGPAERCAVGLSRYFRPGTTALVISSCAGEPESDLVPPVRRHGFPVVLVSPSPLPLRWGTLGLPAEDEHLARRVEELERRGRLSPLWTFGPVVDWSDYWTLSGLTRYLRRPSRRGGA